MYSNPCASSRVCVRTQPSKSNEHLYSPRMVAEIKEGKEIRTVFDLRVNVLIIVLFCFRGNYRRVHLRTGQYYAAILRYKLKFVNFDGTDWLCGAT